MQPKMIHYICEKYAVTSDIPVTVFSEGRAEESFLAFPHTPETGMFSAPVHTLLRQRGGAHYLLTKELLQFGSVWEEESGICAVVGPVSCIASRFRMLSLKPSRRRTPFLPSIRRNSGSI